MSNRPKSLHSLKVKMASVKGRITSAIKKVETACVEFVRKNKETTPTLTINRLAQDILENREKVKKELLKTWM